MDDVSLLVSSEIDSSDSQSKSGEVLVNDEICVFCRNDELNQGRDCNSSVLEWHDERESSSDNGGERNEVVVGDVSGIKHLSPLINGLLREHVDQVVGDLDGGLVSGGSAEFCEDRRLRKVTD